MRWVTGGLGVVLALSVMAVSGVVNARYGMSLARDGFDAYVMLAVAAFADIGKALSWIFFASALARRDVLAAVAAGLIFLSCLSYAVAGSLGFVAMNRAQSTAGVADKGKAANALDAEVARKVAQVAGYGAVEPATVVGKDIEALRQDKRFAASKSCTEATLEPSRIFCAALARREGEQKRSEAVETLEAELKALRAERRLLGGVVEVEKGDFQSALIAQLTAYDIPKIQLSLALLFVVMIESGACFLLWLSLNHIEAARGGGGGRKSIQLATVDVDEVGSPTAASPADLVAFVNAAVDIEVGAETAFSDVVEACKQWCASTHRVPLSDPMIVAGLERFCVVGHIKQRRRGGVTYLVDVVLKSASGRGGTSHVRLCPTLSASQK